MRDSDPGALGDLLMHVARLQRRRWRDALAPWDLLPSQARALRVVTGREAVRLSDLAEALRIAPRSATEVVDALEDRGLVSRTPDPTDRRAVLIRASPEGLRIVGELDAARAADSRALFARLSAEDRAVLGRILAELGSDDQPAAAPEEPRA
jgi:DNA-binding MarR family transcriptional regulator